GARQMNEARHRIPGLTLVEHELPVSLDHADPNSETITIFARELIGDGRDAAGYPLLVFFQGGPGSEATRAASAPAAPTWLARAPLRPAAAHPPPPTPPPRPRRALRR